MCISEAQRTEDVREEKRDQILIQGEFKQYDSYCNYLKQLFSPKQLLQKIPKDITVAVAIALQR